VNLTCVARYRAYDLPDVRRRLVPKPRVTASLIQYCLDSAT
jgi:hypothetical protein